MKCNHGCAKKQTKIVVNIKLNSGIVVQKKLHGWAKKCKMVVNRYLSMDA